METKITSQIIGNILQYYKENLSFPSVRNRTLGVLEGILIAEGKFIPGQKFDFKDVEVEYKNIFGKLRKKIVKETYSDLVIRCANDLLKEKESNDSV